MRIIVTGSSGVIGHSLVPRLWAEGHTVFEYDIAAHPRYDICDPVTLLVAWREFKPDLCIHMAAQVGRLMAEKDPRHSFRVNVEGTNNVARICERNGTKLVNFSTSEVYGANSEYGTPDLMDQNGVYGMTKLVAEGLLNHYCKVGDLQAISIRPFMVYGPYEQPNGEFRSAISNFLDRAMRGEPLIVHSGGVRAWCYVDDFIDALMMILEDHEWDGYDIYSIGTTDYRTMEEIAQIVIATVGQGSYEIQKLPEHFVSAVKKADFHRIQEMGFEPQVGVEDGIAKTYEWLRDAR